MKRIKELLKLFFTMFKIGLFTFGGGYAMVAVIEKDIVEKNSWLTPQEYLDVIAIAESSPGPLAINTATFVGYKIQKIWGSIFATLGVVLPSFIVIYIISFFFEWFLGLEYVGYAFAGIQACVAFLIVSAGIKMLTKLEKNWFNYVMVGLTVGVFLTLEFLAVNFSTIFLILIGGAISLSLYLVKYMKDKSKKEGK